MNIQGSIRACGGRRGAGFTLLELMVTIAVLGVLTAIAIPAFTQSIASARLSSTAATLYATLSQARAEAIQRNGQPVQFCADNTSANTSDTLGSACGTRTGAVFATNADGSTPTRAATGPTIPSGITLSTNAIPVMPLRFYGQGVGYQINSTVPYTGLVAGLYASNITNNNLRCLYLTTGRVISLCQVTSSSGACPDNEPNPCTTN